MARIVESDKNTSQGMGPEWTYTPEVEAETAHLYKRVQRIMPQSDWMRHAPLIAQINRLKAEKNAVILAHNYQTPEIFYGVADITGDSLALAYDAKKVDADIIVMAGVHFMAETAKLVNPDKTVLMPDLEAGCSLAESITGDDVRMLKQKYPGVPVVTYVNTSAEVKAQSDICCTSANAIEVVNSLPGDKVISLPDRYLSDWIARHTDKTVIKWEGSCMVHETFTAAEIAEMRGAYPGLTVLAHPECPSEVLDAADYVGSTTQMADYVTRTKPSKVVLVTECSMSDNVAAGHDDIEFVRPCNLCPHMKRITLSGIYAALSQERHKIEIAPDLAASAVKSVQAMLDVSAKHKRKAA